MCCKILQSVLGKPVTMEEGRLTTLRQPWFGRPRGMRCHMERERERRG